MDVFKKRRFKPLFFLLGLLLVGSLHAREIPVRSISASIEPASAPPVVRLSGETALTLPGAVEKALDNGITLDFEYEVFLKRSRRFLWDPTIFHWIYRRQLSFFALSSKYVVSTDQDNSAQVFTSLHSAMQYLNKLETIRLALPQDVPDLGKREYLEFQMRLDIESLPLPMRPLAYVSSKWRLSTDWVDVNLAP